MIKHMTYGSLALEYGDVMLPLRVCLSFNGRYYLGTVDETGEPISRESVEYFSSYKDAESALKSGDWTQRDEL